MTLGGLGIRIMEVATACGCGGGEEGAVGKKSHERGHWADCIE